MAMVGVMGAAVFLVWPIWIGPLMMAVAMGLMCARGLRWRARVQAACWRGPVRGGRGHAPVAARGLVGDGGHERGRAGVRRRAARVVLIVLALAGAVAWRRFAGARVTLWFLGVSGLQALALWCAGPRARR